MQIDKKEYIQSQDLSPEIVESRHIAPPFRIIEFGLESALPNGSTRTKAFFATDTNKLYMWNGSAWVSTTLS